MEQEVAQMESEDSGPVLQPVDKPEGSVELVKEDSTIPNPEDIGPTGDNTVTDSSIDTPIENQDETEGMEVDEPGPSLDGGLESVNNEENVSAVDNSEQGNVDNVENVSESNSANNNQEVLMEMDQELSDVPETVESGAETVEETESTNIENTNQTDEGNGANDLKESTDDVCDVATGVDDVNEQPETGSCIDTGNTDNADIEQFGTLNPAEEESERSNYSDNFKIENSNFGLNAAENDNGDNDNVADNQEQEEVDEGEEDNTECVEPESLVQDAIEEETESKEVENSKTEADDISYSKENASCNKDTPNINNDSEDVDQSNETVDENAGEILSDIKAQDDGLGNIEISSVRGAEDSNDDKDNDTKEDGDNKAIVGENDDGGDVESQVNPSQSEETTESVAEQIQENSNISTDVQQMEDPKSPTESIEIPEDEESQEMETDSSDKGIELAITSVEGNVAISNVEGNVGRSGDRQDSVESTEMDITENIDSDDNENVDNNDEDGEVQKEVVIDEDGADETSEAKTAENSTGDDNTDEITKNVTEDDIPVIKDVQTLSEAPSEEQTGDSFKSDADDVDKPKDEAEGSNDASADDGKESSNETNTRSYIRKLKQMRWAVQRFKDWMKESGLPSTDFEWLCRRELNALLERFYATAQTKKEKKSFTKAACYTIRAGINRYLNMPPINRSINLRKDIEFLTSNKLLNILKTTSRVTGTGINTYAASIESTDIQKLYESGVFSESSPFTLQNKVLFDIIGHLGKYSKHGLYNLKTNALITVFDKDGRKFVRLDKNQCGIELKNGHRQKRMYATDAKYCPVRSFEKYIGKLNPKCQHFFQQPISDSVTEGDPVWYSDKPISMNAFDNFMPVMSKDACLSRTYTIHSIRPVEYIGQFEKESIYLEQIAVEKHIGEKSQEIYRSQSQNTLAGLLEHKPTLCTGAREAPQGENRLDHYGDQPDDDPASLEAPQGENRLDHYRDQPDDDPATSEAPQGEHRFDHKKAPSETEHANCEVPQGENGLDHYHGPLENEHAYCEVPQGEHRLDHYKAPSETEHASFEAPHGENRLEQFRAVTEDMKAPLKRQTFENNLTFNQTPSLVVNVIPSPRAKIWQNSQKLNKATSKNPAAPSTTKYDNSVEFNTWTSIKDHALEKTQKSQNSYMVYHPLSMAETANRIRAEENRTLLELNSAQTKQELEAIWAQKYGRYQFPRDWQTLLEKNMHALSKTQSQCEIPDVVTQRHEHNKVPSAYVPSTQTLTSEKYENTLQPDRPQLCEALKATQCGNVPDFNKILPHDENASQEKQSNHFKVDFYLVPLYTAAPTTHKAEIRETSFKPNRALSNDAVEAQRPLRIRHEKLTRAEAPGSHKDESESTPDRTGLDHTPVAQGSYRSGIEPTSDGTRLKKAPVTLRTLRYEHNADSDITSLNQAHIALRYQRLKPNTNSGKTLLNEARAGLDIALHQSTMETGSVRTSFNKEIYVDIIEIPQPTFIQAMDNIILNNYYKVPNISEDSKDSNTAKETSDISNNVNDGPDNSRVSKDVETMETETGDSRDRNTSESLSEESGERKSSSPTDTSDAGVSMTSVKIKQERMENAEAADEGSSLKIADVTSTAGDDGKDSATVKKENFAKDEALITEQTTQTKDEGSKPTVEKKDDDVIAVKEEKKPTPKVKSSKIQTCIVCKKVVKCKYNIVRNGDVKHLCDDNCFKCFRTNPTTYLKQAEGKKEEAVPESLSQSSASPAAAGAKKPATQPTPITQQTGLKQYRSLITNSITNGNLDVKSALRSHIKQSQVYKTCTVCQLMNVHRTSKPFLNWLGLDFCGEECLGKFQNGLGTNCSYCSGAIFPNNKAKFCCRVGNDVKQFCSTNCNNDFIKRMKLCAYCNKDLTQVKDSFMAPVGNQGTFKDFCSQPCLQKFEEKNNKDVENGQEPAGEKTAVAPKGNFTCAVCSKVGPVKFEFKLDSKLNRLCSDPCASAFQYANKLSLNACDHCHTNMATDVQAPQYVQFEGQQKRFCSFMCVNNFMNVNKKIVLCGWCGNKKNNFDMIERVDANNKYQLFCSLNCLSLYRVNLQASSNQSVMCDQCRKYVPAQYHLTMSDASVRNFCSYGCVMHFQQQFQVKQTQPNAAAGKTVSQMLQAQKQQQTTTRSGRVVTKGAKLVEQPMATKKRKDSSDLIIQNVMSLAPQVPNKVAAKVTSIPASAQTQQQQQFKQTTSVAGSQTVQQKIIIQPPPPVPMKNKSLLCKPITQTKATSCRPHTQTKEVQTDGKAEPEKLLVPVPVPIYCPTPLAMYSLPTPVIIPIPVPIPVPVFIPTTKKSANSILKQIKEIREKIPADPLEAELLMMAEAVAGKDDDSSSSSEDEDTTAPVPVVKETPSVTAASSGGGELGEDMLQMALRMASEMSDEPVMDLETSLEPVAVNTEPPPPPKPEIQPEPVEEDEEYIPARTRRSGRGGAAKRSSRSSTRRQPKRQKIEVQPVYREPTPSPPAPAAPPPDANFHLKYTYGVNAFKHWVIQKNSQLEQSAKPGQGKSLKTFKTDILQCTADELNYSLCLFVKEVRKPNGEEYAVDSIYYLCLGIQQYLFENGRIDNIFTDFYYERFTEGLNEILTRYEPKLNHAGQLVCRIEEEHLWESKQLGAHSPHVLLNSLVYFNTKYFMLKTSEDHLKLSFTHIMKHWKKTASGRGSGTGPNAGRSVYLRYYCPTPQGKVDNQKKKKEEMPVYEQTENIENPLRCPVKLYEFYLSKCPESIKSRNDTFYLQAERSSVPDSPVWYSNISVDGDRLAKLLNRIRLVREIQEAHLHTQPIYI